MQDSYRFLETFKVLQFTIGKIMLSKVLDFVPQSLKVHLFMTGIISDIKVIINQILFRPLNPGPN